MKIVSVFVLDGEAFVNFHACGGFRERDCSYRDVSPRSLDRLARCVMSLGAEIRPFLAGCVGYTATMWKKK